jgi:hypothetical protein
MTFLKRARCSRKGAKVVLCCPFFFQLELESGLYLLQGLLGPATNIIITKVDIITTNIITTNIITTNIITKVNVITTNVSRSTYSRNSEKKWPY